MGELTRAMVESMNLQSQPVSSLGSVAFEETRPLTSPSF